MGLLDHKAVLSKEQVSLISWLQSPSAVILESPNVKSVTVSIVSPSIFHDWFDLLAVEVTLKSLLQCFSWCY